MKLYSTFVIRISCLGMLFLVAFSTNAQNKSLKNSRPNIIYILADDLGIGDLSIYNENSKNLIKNAFKL